MDETCALKEPSRDLTLAKVLLRLQRPLPVDLTSRLLEAGVDVGELERRFCA